MLMYNVIYNQYSVVSSVLCSIDWCGLWSKIEHARKAKVEYICEYKRTSSSKAAFLFSDLCSIIDAHALPVTAIEVIEALQKLSMLPGLKSVDEYAVRKLHNMRCFFSNFGLHNSDVRHHVSKLWLPQCDRLKRLLQNDETWDRCANKSSRVSSYESDPSA